MASRPVSHGHTWPRSIALALLCVLDGAACQGIIKDQPSGAPRGAGGNAGSSVAACATIAPGRVTIHRLNIVEYDNTVRDLLGDTAQPGNGFPDDTGGGNFDNNADVLSTSPLLFEKLDDAAEALATTALTPGSATRAHIVSTCPACATSRSRSSPASPPVEAGTAAAPPSVPPERRPPPARRQTSGSTSPR